MMHFVEEHQDIPNEVAAVMPVRGMRKRHRVQELAAERHQELKERTRGYCRSQKRVTVADRRMSRHTSVAWRKRKLIRNIRIQKKIWTTQRVDHHRNEDPQ
jgi:hypothetical protein